ncbi:hypothetical protein ACFLX0_01390 [Chloroflexota bacterium]
MMAKPIININVVIEPRAFPSVRDRLVPISYIHRSNLRIHGREAFGLINADEKSNLRTHNLFITFSSSPQ